MATVVERISNPPKIDPELSALSPQEQRLLDLIAEGLTNRQIAEAMFLAEHTVKNYMTNLLRKLKMNSRTEAAIYATKRRARRRTRRRAHLVSGSRSGPLPLGQASQIETGRRQRLLDPGAAPRVGARSSDR